MALGDFVAGAYDGTWIPTGGDANAPFDLGIMEDDGFSIELTHLKEVIENTDRFGAMAIEGIRRGGNCFMEWKFLEWSAAALMVAFPYATPAVTGDTFLGPGPIGALDTAAAGTLVLGAELGTPAANSPATIGAAFPVIAEGFPIKFLLTSKLRRLPVRLRIYPYVDNEDSVLKWLSFS